MSELLFLCSLTSNYFPLISYFDPISTPFFSPLHSIIVNISRLPPLDITKPNSDRLIFILDYNYLGLFIPPSAPRFPACLLSVLFLYSHALIISVRGWLLDQNNIWCSDCLAYCVLCVLLQLCSLLPRFFFWFLTRYCGTGNPAFSKANLFTFGRWATGGDGFITTLTHMTTR